GRLLRRACSLETSCSPWREPLSTIRTISRVPWKATPSDRRSKPQSCGAANRKRSRSLSGSGPGGTDMRGFGEIAERLRRSTVQLSSKGERGGGSGIVWSAEGMILTNAHVARSNQAEVELWDGRRLDGSVASRDPRRDLAIVRVAASGLEAVTSGDSSVARP